MILTKEIKDKIKEAWNCQAATTCSWAMSELDKFAIAALNSGKIEVHNYATEIQDLKDFFIWKKQEPVISEIPVLRALTQGRLTDNINNLISEFAINQIKFKPTDINNRNYQLNLNGSNGTFDLDIGKLINTEIFPIMTQNVIKLRIINVNEKIFRLTFKTKTTNFLGITKGLINNSVDFCILRIR